MPAGPAGLVGRIAAAVIKHVVDAGENMSSNRYFTSDSFSVKCSASQVPVSELTSGLPVTCRRTTRIWKLIVAVGVKHFRFGNVSGGVKVEPVAGRTVRLVARDEAVFRATISSTRAAIPRP